MANNAFTEHLAIDSNQKINAQDKGITDDDHVPTTRVIVGA